MSAVLAASFSGAKIVRKPCHEKESRLKSTHITCVYFKEKKCGSRNTSGISVPSNEANSRFGSLFGDFLEGGISVSSSGKNCRQFVKVYNWFGGSNEELTSDTQEKSNEELEAEKQAEEQRKKYSKLIVSIMVDGVGLLTAKNVLDLDFGWSPVAAFIIQRMYRAPLLTTVGFFEQIIPGASYLPTATLGWCVESVPQLEWITRLPFMGASMKSKERGFWSFLPFGKKD